MVRLLCRIGIKQTSHTFCESSKGERRSDHCAELASNKKNHVLSVGVTKVKEGRHGIIEDNIHAIEMDKVRDFRTIPVEQTT